MLIWAVGNPLIPSKEETASNKVLWNNNKEQYTGNIGVLKMPTGRTIFKFIRSDAVNIRGLLKFDYFKDKPSFFVSVLRVSGSGVIQQAEQFKMAGHDKASQCPNIPFT